MNTKHRRNQEHLAFRELCFDLQFVTCEEEKDAIIKQMIKMKDQCEDPCEVREMIKSIGANLDAA